MNIHSFNDRRNEPQNENQQPFLNNMNANPETAFYLGNQNQGDPRNESFIQMIKFNFCPTASLKSFTILLGITLFVFFIIQIIVDGINLKGELLEIKLTGPLSSHLIIDTTTKSKKMQLWRYLTSLLLSPNLSLLVTFLIIILFFLSFFERFMGSKQIALIFLLSNLLVNLLIGIIGTYKTSLGSIAGVFGVFGSGVSYLVINYSRMESSQNLRYIFSCNLVFVIIIGKSYKLN